MSRCFIHQAPYPRELTKTNQTKDERIEQAADHQQKHSDIGRCVFTEFLISNQALGSYEAFFSYRYAIPHFLHSLFLVVTRFSYLLGHENVSICRVMRERRTYVSAARRRSAPLNGELVLGVFRRECSSGDIAQESKCTY